MPDAEAMGAEFDELTEAVVMAADGEEELELELMYGPAEDGVLRVTV